MISRYPFCSTAPIFKMFSLVAKFGCKSMTMCNIPNNKTNRHENRSVTVYHGKASTVVCHSITMFQCCMIEIKM